MVFKSKSRIFVGLLILITVLFSFLFNLDIFFLSLILILITYEIFYIKIVNIIFLIICIIISVLSFLFISYKQYEYLFILQLFFILGIILFNNYKKEFFVFSLYIFCAILFYLVNLDRNFFYLLFLISFFNDSVAYISGNTLRGPLILPKTSPNKTWSGTAISFLSTTILLFIMNFNIFVSMIFSILLFFGDIFFSHIKRHLRIKDFSPLLGSHGGILDRLDSMFFVAISFQIYLVYF